MDRLEVIKAVSIGLQLKKDQARRDIVRKAYRELIRRQPAVMYKIYA